MPTATEQRILDAQAKVQTDTKSLVSGFMTKLDGITATIYKIIDKLTCPEDSDCYKIKHDTALKKIYDDKKKIIDDNLAAQELSLAEKNYFTYNAGNDGGADIYNKMIFDRYAKTAEDLKENSIEKQKEFTSNIAQNLKQYQGEYLFAARTSELLANKIQENKELKKKLDMYTRILNTNERKVVYQDRDTGNLNTYRRVMLFFYYSAIIFYIIFGNFIPDKLYLKYSAWVVVVIFSIIPIILNMIMKWIFIIADTIGYWFSEIPHKDVYLDL